MDDKKLRYSREFLNKSNDCFKLKKNQYVPEFHVYPSKGLLNDPNCVFYKNKKYYIFFQHHPNNPIHGLKTMSLFTVNKNLLNSKYYFMVNKPEEDFDFHGTYSGNAILKENKIVSFYTGNKRDLNWERTSHIIKAEFDIESKKFLNKKIVCSNKDFKKYTDHFRDPFIFKYKRKNYFLLGAQRKKDLLGVILLFKLDKNLENPILLKEIIVSKQYRMIECPSIAFVDNKVVFIYSPQYKETKLELKQNPDTTSYSIIDNLSEIIYSTKKEYLLKKEQKLDYGLEFYAPQTFLVNNHWCLIAWSGIPTSNNYPESKNGWIFLLSMIKKMSIVNNELILTELKEYKKNYLNSKNEFVKYLKIELKNNEKIFFYDGSINNKKLVINLLNNNLFIKRLNDSEYYPYSSKSLISLDEKNENVVLEVFIDNSIIEIKINQKYWYTARIYFDESINFQKE